MNSRPDTNNAQSLFERIASIGSRPDDSIGVRTSKRSLVLSAVVAAVAVAPWPIPYLMWGIWQAAIIPISYIVMTVAGCAYFARTGRVTFFRTSQIIMFTVLPLLVHIALGGFVNSSAVIVYASAGAVQALSFYGTKRAIWWFGAFVTVVAIAALLDERLAANAPYVPDWAIRVFFGVNIVTVALIAFVTLIVYINARDILTEELSRERARSDALLLNVLPPSIAGRLKDGEAPIADRHDNVAVLFADIVGFTGSAASLTPDELVDALNRVFGAFDELARSRNLEKVKTIGDAYMVVAGAPEGRDDGLPQIAALAIEMRDTCARLSLDGVNPIEMRFGIDVGPVVAGVIGTSKFTYDLYGDTVNTASRMESSGTGGEIQVTERAKEALEPFFEFEPRGLTEIKGKGSVETYFLGSPIHSDRA